MDLRTLSLRKYLLVGVYFLGITITFFNTTAIPIPVMVQKSLILLMITLYGFIFMLQIPAKKITQYILLLCLIMLLLLNYIHSMQLGEGYSSDYEMILTVIFIFLIDFGDVKLYLKESFFVKIFYLSFTVIMYILGLSTDKILYSSTGQIRHAYGFSSPNGLGVMLLVLSIELIVLFWSKYKIKSVFIATIVNIIGYSITKSRTALIAFIIFLFITAVIKFGMNHLGKSKIFIIFPGIVMFIGFFYEFFYTNNLFWNTVNRLFSNRLVMGKYYTDMYPISLLGTPIKTTQYTLSGLVLNNGATFLVDSAYTRIILQWGLLSVVIIFYFILKKMYVYVKSMDYLNYSLIAMILVYGFSERIAYNVFLFTPLLVLSTNTGKMKEEK